MKFKPETLIYLFTGFLESGKTKLIKETLADPDFSDGEKTLIIQCEEGIEEYVEKELKQWNAQLVVVDEEEQFTVDFLNECHKKYKPERVMIEYNGTWSVEKLMDMLLPKGWALVQVLTTIAADTFDAYMTNMRSLLVPQFTYSDAVIFNRCTKETQKASYRRMVKAVNPKAQLVYELLDGSIDNTMDEILPFDITKEIIEIKEEDYGIWYLDALDHPEHYNGKELVFKAVTYIPKEGKGNWFVPGRFAMTCCADDVAFIGFKCYSNEISKYSNREWVMLNAVGKIEYVKEYEGEGLVLSAKKMEPTEKTKEELVYFT